MADNAALERARARIKAMREGGATEPSPVVAAPTESVPADDALSRARAKVKAMRAEAPTPTPDARSRRDYASAHPEETLAAVEIARAQVERDYIEEGKPPETARAMSYRDAADMMLTRPSRAAEANIRASEEMPSLTGTATRVLAPGVRAVEPHPTTKQEREAQYRSEVTKIDASLGNLQGAVDAFHTAWEGSTPPMSAEDYGASVGDKDWLQGAKQAVENIGRMNIGTVTLGLLGDLPTVDRLKAQASLVGDVIDNLSADPDLPKVVSFEGYGEIAKRAAVKAGAPDAAAFVGEHLGLLKPREANALRQDAIDARPAEHFDMLAPRIHEAATSDDPEAWSAGLDALLSLPPSIIPDKDVINSPDVARFRAAIEATPDAFDDEAWAGVKQRVKQKAGDTEVELALRQVPLGALVGVQPDLMPDMNAIARLVERRDDARKKWGGATTEALERLVTAAAITPATKDGQPVYVESTPAQVMRLAGTAFEMLAEADVPAYDLNPTAWAIAAIGDAAGAKDFTAHVRNARVPTKRGLDVMLSTGAYDDMLSMAGLGPYRPLLGNDSSSWGARVLADVIYPEFQGLGLSATAERAGMDPTSTLATTLDVIDLGAGFLVPAEEIVAAPVGIVARTGLRARQGARAMPKGYKLRGAAAKAVPSVWSAFRGEKLLDIDGDTALHHALLSAVEQETKAGREVKIPAGYWDSVKAAARSIGADPDVLLAEVKTSLELRRARTFENMADMVAREATPEMEALRKTPEYVRVANELDALVKAGMMPADKALGSLMMDEVRAFILADEGKVASPEDYFARVSREVGGTSGAGAYFQGEPVAGAGPAFRAWFKDSVVKDEAGRPLPMYHGTGYAGIEAFDPELADPHGLYGPGLYFTADPEIASSYTEKAARGGAVTAEERASYFTPGNIVEGYAGRDRVLRYEDDGPFGWRVLVERVDDDGKAIERARWHSTEPNPARIMGRPGPGVLPVHLSIQRPFDVDAPATPELRDAILAAAERHRDMTPEDIAGIRGLIQIDDTVKPMGRDAWTYRGWPITRDGTGAFHTSFKPGKDFASLEEAVAATATSVRSTGQDVYDAIAGTLSNAGVDEAKTITNEILRDAGFDGITHIGGGRVGDKPHRVFIAFDPTQIKSAIGNRGTFDPNDPNILHSTIGGKQTEQGTIERVVRQPAPTFYSALRRTVEGIKQERLTADQLRATLRNAPGVKADEIEWTGLDRFLAEHPKPTKSEVLGWLDENAVEVKVLRRDSKPARDHRAWLSELKDVERSIEDQAAILRSVREAMRAGDGGGLLGQVVRNQPRVDAASEALRRLYTQRDAIISRTVPEPPPGMLPTKWTLNDYRAEKLELPGGEDSFEIQMILPQKVTRGETFTGGHWDEPGVVVHYRANKRRGSDGKLRIHVEEVQSDWHQAGRDAGYAPESDKKQANSAAYKTKRFLGEQQQEIIAAAMRDEPPGGEGYRRDDATKKLLAGTHRLSDRYKELIDQQIAIGKELDSIKGAVPPAPFADAWSDLALKHLLRVVAEDPEVEGITWTTSEHQRARYPVDNEGKPRDIQNGPEYRTTYDVAIPSFLNKQGKKYGARVGKVEIPLGAEEPPGGWNWQAYPEAIAKADAAGDAELGRTLREMADWEYGDGEGATEAFGTPLAARADAALAEAVESVKAKAGPETTVVHSFDIPPKMRDALLYEGQPLFQKTSGTIHGSIEPTTIGYLQRFFQTADFNTLLHEDAHLLRFLFGDRWTSDLAKHFEHTIDPRGFTVLTRKGEEQAAEALRLYMRSRTHPNGRLRAKLEDSYYALQDLYLRMRGQTPNLPVELRAMWDATLRPDDAIRPSAILLADHEIPGPRPMSLLPPRTPEGDIVAVGENRMARAGRKAEAEKVLVDRARVLQAIGLPSGVNEVDPEKTLAHLIAFVGVERARQGIQGEDWVKLTDRSMVPKGRLERIRRAVKGDLRLVLGTDDWRPLIDEANQTIRLDAPQAAAMRGLITDLANEPYGATLPRSVLDFDGTPGTMAIKDWNTVQAHLADRHAGVGSSMDQRVWAARGPLLGAFLRSMKDVVVDADTTKQAEKLAQDADRKFRVDVSAAQYMAPGVRDAYEGFIRSLGESGRTVVGWIRQATEAPGGATKTFGEIAKDVLPHLAPPIDPTVAPDLLSWSRKFRGEGELARTGGVSGLTIDLVTDDTTLTDIGSVLQSANGITDDERVALLALHRTRGELAALGPDPLVRADYFLKNGHVIADAVSIVETGLRRRSAVVERQARHLWLSLAGSSDEAVWLRLGVDENATKPEDNAYIRAYQLFHEGDWNGMFRLADERAQLMVGGHEYNQGQAILSMFTRLYTEQLWTNFTHSLYDMGIDTDVDKAAVKGAPPSARLPKSYELGSRRGGRDVFARAVLENIQAEVGWKNRERLVENRVEGGPRTFEPAEGAPGPKGVEDMEAYARAQQILHQLGWKYGKGAFDASPVLLPDGSEVYLPQMMTAEVAGVIDRVAKVGVAFADTTSGGAGIFGAGERRLAQVVLPDAKTAAEIRMRQGARLGGAVTGGVLGAIAAGPIGAMAGAAFGSRLAPTMAETAGSFARMAAREATDMGAGALARPAAVAAGAVGAVAGAVKGSTGAAIGTLLSTFHTTTSLARVGMTTGLLIPNVSSFVGNLWGAFFQTYQVRGLSGALRAWGTNPRMLGDVVGRLWGDGPMRYRLGSKPIVTPDGRILTAEMITRDFAAHGLDSSFPKSESAEAMSTDVARSIGTWPQRFLEDPADALGAGPRWLQHQLTEAWTSIDNMNRVAVYVDALHEGRSVAEAAELARLAAFDYGNLTDFERSVMRNTVLFYSFMRQNIRLFWHTMIHDPHRVLAQLRLASGLQREFVEDEPYLTFPEYAQGRLVLDFRKAAIDAFGSQQGVATLSPPMPAMDVINLTSDLLGLALGDQDAAQEVASRAVPWVQGGIVAAFNIDPWSGRDLSGQSEVPQFLVEGDRMATGGIVVDALLDVRRVFDAAKGRYAYKAGNEKMWWFYRNVLQLPPAGRSMSTLEQIDRAAPFGSQPVSDVVDMLRTYREGGGSETLDAFFAGPANAAVTWSVGGDPLAPYVFEAPSNVDDLAAPRPGVDVSEERRKLLGFPTTTIPTVEANADTIHAQIRRQAQKAGNKARSGEDFK